MKLIRTVWMAVALAGAALGCSLGCGSSDSAPTSQPGPETYPGACVCYASFVFDLSFRSCVVTADLATCRSTVTTCNPVFYTNSDCTYWCAWSPQQCP